MIYEACALLWATQFAAFTVWTVSRIDRSEPLTLLAFYIGGSILISLLNGLLMAVLTIAAARRVTHVTAPTVNATALSRLPVGVGSPRPAYRAIRLGPVAVAVRRLHR